MRAGRPTNAMPKPNVLCAPAFSHSVWLCCHVAWCQVVGCEGRWNNVVSCEVGDNVLRCEMSCHVWWCDVASRHHIWCDVKWYHVMSCDVLSCDVMRCDGMLCACDEMWLVVRSCYVMRSVCVIWWIGRWCAVNFGGLMSEYYHSELQNTTRYYI